MSPRDQWQEEWRFNLDREDAGAKQKIRGYVQFGGKLTYRDYFLPRAQEVCKERNLILIKVEDFRASADLHRDKYTISALVTLERNPSE